MALFTRPQDVPPLLRHGVEGVTAEHVRDHNLLVRIIPLRPPRPPGDIGFNDHSKRYLSRWEACVEALQNRTIRANHILGATVIDADWYLIPVSYWMGTEVPPDTIGGQEGQSLVMTGSGRPEWRHTEKPSFDIDINRDRRGLKKVFEEAQQIVIETRRGYLRDLGLSTDVLDYISKQVDSPSWTEDEKDLHKAAEQFAPDLSIDWEVRAITDMEAGVPDRIIVDTTAALYWYVHGQEKTYVIDYALRINLQVLLKDTNRRRDAYHPKRGEA